MNATRPEGRRSIERPADATEALELVRQSISGLEGIEASAISPESRLEDDLAMDSLSRVELQLMLEEALGTDLPDDAAGNARTVADVVALVIGHRV